MTIKCNVPSWNFELWCWRTFLRVDSCPRWKAGGEGDNRRWDGWMASLTWWTWVWANSRSWWWTGKPSVLQSMGLWRVRHDWAIDLMSIESVMSSNKLILLSPSVAPSSSCLQTFPAFGSFPMSQLFASGDQSIGASMSALPMNIQGLFLLELTGLMSLLSKWLSRVFSSTTFQKYQFFSALPSLWSNSHIHT